MPQTSEIRSYEAFLALHTSGKEEGNKETIDRLEKEFTAEGVKITQVQRLEKREFAYPHHHVHSAYCVNFIFDAAPPVIQLLKEKFKLDNEILLHQYSRLPRQKKKV